MPGTHPPIFWLRDVNGNIPQYYYVLSDIADQYWLPSVRSASSRFHSAVRRHLFASVRQADSRLTRLVPPTLNSRWCHCGFGMLIPNWLSGLRSAKNKNSIWRTRFLLLWPSRLEHSSFRPARHYWHRYIQKTTQECTLWSCLGYHWILLALLDVSYSGPCKFHVDWLIDW